MKFASLVTAALAALLPCVSAHGSEISLQLDAGGGQWYAYASAYNCDGIASFIIDVKGVSGDLLVTSSACMAPRGYDAGVGAMFGFAQYDDGVNGIGVYAGQPTLYGGDNNNPTKDTLVLRDVGISAGSHLGVSWAAPVLLAQGTYSGTEGQLKLEVGDGFFNTLDEPWTGPGHVTIASVVTPSYETIPEPATLTALGAGLGVMALFRRRRS